MEEEILLAYLARKTIIHSKIGMGVVIYGSPKTATTFLDNEFIDMSLLQIHVIGFAFYRFTCVFVVGGITFFSNPLLLCSTRLTSSSLHTTPCCSLSYLKGNLISKVTKCNPLYFFHFSQGLFDIYCLLVCLYMWIHRHPLQE